MEKDTKKKKQAIFFKDGVDYDWQTTTEFNDLVKSFHNKNARQPTGAIKGGKELLTVFLRKLQPLLRTKNLCSDLRFTGSSYEGVKVKKDSDDDDLEFDVMVFIDVPDVMIEQTDKCGYVKLKYVDSNGRFSTLTEKSYLHPHKFVNHFIWNLKDCNRAVQDEAGQEEARPNAGSINPGDVPIQDEDTEREGNNRDDVPNGSLLQRDHIMFFKNMDKYHKLHRHGPAVKMDVTKVETDASTDNLNKVQDTKLVAEKPWFSVDIVPTLRIRKSNENDPEYYVAKPTKHSQYDNTWRRSYSIDEKRKFRNMDSDNGCRKQVYRILKVIRNREASLARISSYILKTVLFREIDKNPYDKDSWKDANLGQRLMDMIRRLQMELESGKVKHFCLDMNLLDDQATDINGLTLNQMSQRFKCLNNSKKKMEKLLRS